MPNADTSDKGPSHLGVIYCDEETQMYKVRDGIMPYFYHPSQPLPQSRRELEKQVFRSYIKSICPLETKLYDMLFTCRVWGPRITFDVDEIEIGKLRLSPVPVSVNRYDLDGVNTIVEMSLGTVNLVYYNTYLVMNTYDELVTEHQDPIYVMKLNR